MDPDDNVLSIDDAADLMSRRRAEAEPEEPETDAPEQADPDLPDAEATPEAPAEEPMELLEELAAQHEVDLADILALKVRDGEETIALQDLLATRQESKHAAATRQALTEQLHRLSVEHQTTAQTLATNAQALHAALQTAQALGEMAQISPQMYSSWEEYTAADAAIRQHREKVASHVKEAQTRYAEAMQAQMAQRAAIERHRLTLAVPTWHQLETQKAATEAMLSVGWSPEEIMGNGMPLDHRVYRMAHELAALRAQAGGVAETQKKTEAAKAAAKKKLVKRGPSLTQRAGAGNAPTGAQAKASAAAERFKKTGSVDDAARLMTARRGA